MKISNQTRNSVLADNATIAGSLFARMKGLLGRKELKRGEALVLAPCNSIHTFFMKFPIDIIFLDKDKRIVKIIPSLQPFRLSGIYFNAASAIELTAGLAEAQSASVGDLLFFG
ncbi:MAG: DUF192 domain-containing protein [Candidatus Omnitrophica bacterium]|nr:DUF192 domain-containing protein [Candidatus Omnitrophota bacterium]